MNFPFHFHFDFLDMNNILVNYSFCLFFGIAIGTFIFNIIAYIFSDQV